MTKVAKLKHKKREHEALLYKLEVKLNSDGNVMFNYEWIKPITEKLGCRVLCSKGEFNNGKLKELKEILDKGKAVKKLKDSNKSIISTSQISYPLS